MNICLNRRSELPYSHAMCFHDVLCSLYLVCS